MSALHDGIINGLSGVLAWFWTVVQALWGLVQGVVDVLGAVLIDVVGHALGFVVTVAFALLGVFTGLLPNMPTLDGSSVSPALQSLAMADRYLPLSEMLLLLPVWGVVFAGIMIYKGWKALPFT